MLYQTGLFLCSFLGALNILYQNFPRSFTVQPLSPQIEVHIFQIIERNFWAPKGHYYHQMVRALPE